MKILRLFCIVFILLAVQCMVFVYAGSTQYCKICKKNTATYQDFIQDGTNGHYYATLCKVCDNVIDYGERKSHRCAASLNKYTYIDNDKHSVVQSCQYCGYLPAIVTYHFPDEKVSGKDYTPDYYKSFEPYDSESHNYTYWCRGCLHDITGSGPHTWEGTDTYAKLSGELHNHLYECKYCKDKKYLEENHVWEGVDTFERLSDTQHNHLYRCAHCEATENIAEDHEWRGSDVYNSIDNDHHNHIYKCSECSAEKDETEDHTWEDTDTYEQFNDNQHYRMQKCSNCEATRLLLENHDFQYIDDYEKCDDEKHYHFMKCKHCNTVVKTDLDKEDHSWKKTGEYSRLNKEYHYQKYKCSKCDAEAMIVEDHSWRDTDMFEEYNDEQHCKIQECSLCGETGSVPVEHKWRTIDATYKNNNNNYESFDDNSHYILRRCIVCNAVVRGELDSHELINTKQYLSYNDTHHHVITKCRRCLTEILKPEEHRFNSTKKMPFNGEQHYLTKECKICGQIIKTPENHSWQDEKEDDDVKYYDYRDILDDYEYMKQYYKEHYKPYSDRQHSYIAKCSCGETKEFLQGHKFYYVKTVKDATLSSKGIKKYKCTECGQTANKSFSWKKGDDDSAWYLFDHSSVFRNSKSVTVSLNYGAKGAVLKVKIGSKTYSKKIKNNKTKQKIKIKKPKKYGQKVKITLTYKGKVIAKDTECVDIDRVWYSSRLRKGMSKRQAKYTYGWYWPSSKKSYRNGISIWWYGWSWIAFKHGKVVRWCVN